jgi:hypothetical protein
VTTERLAAIRWQLSRGFSTVTATHELLAEVDRLRALCVEVRPILEHYAECGCSGVKVEEGEACWCVFCACSRALSRDWPARQGGG